MKFICKADFLNAASQITGKLLRVKGFAKKGPPKISLMRLMVFA